MSWWKCRFLKQYSSKDVTIQKSVFGIFWWYCHFVLTRCEIQSFGLRVHALLIFVYINFFRTLCSYISLKCSTGKFRIVLIPPEDSQRRQLIFKLTSYYVYWHSTFPLINPFFCSCCWNVISYSIAFLYLISLICTYNANPSLYYFIVHYMILNWKVLLAGIRPLVLMHPELV